MIRVVGNVLTPRRVLIVAASCVVAVTLVRGGVLDRADDVITTTPTTPILTATPTATFVATDDPRVGDDATGGPTNTFLEASALRFMSAWLDVDVGHDDWLAELKSQVTPELYDLLAYVDLTDVPNTRPPSAATVLRSGPTYAEVEVVLDNDVGVLLTFVYDGQGWRVGELQSRTAGR